MPSTASLTKATRAVEDAFYISVGAGVLAVQSAQVRRRELQARLAEQFEDPHGTVARIREGADDGLRIVEHQVDEVLEHVEERLPPTARELLDKGRAAGAEARQTVHEVLRPSTTEPAPT